MNKIVKQLIKTFNLMVDEDFSCCYLPNSLCYPHTGYMINYNELDNTISLAEDIAYCINQDNNPTIMFCGNTTYPLDNNSYNNIVNNINDLLNKHTNVIKQIKNNLINNQLDSIKTDF